MSDDFLTVHLRQLPYFRSLLRSIEAEFYQGQELPTPTLDVGAGDGHFASVALQGMVDVGLDPDRASLREAKRRQVYRWLTEADGHRMPFAPSSFGSAVSNSVLEHIPGLEGVLAELGRVLRPGAPLVFTVPNPGYAAELSFPAVLEKAHLRRLGGVYRAWFVRMSRTWNMFDMQGWGARLDDAGFDVEESFNYFPPRSLHTLEWGHYFGVPCLIPRKTVGRWILAPYRWNLWLTDRIVRRYHDVSPCGDGTYSYYRARKR
jgi:SAM-dependent methyltransferase